MYRQKTTANTGFTFVAPRRVLTGPEVWLSMPENLLNKDAKALLNADPNLTRETMARLLQAQPITHEAKFYFGLDDKDDANKDDIGVTLLSICINENLSQSMAELVARYATARKLPFTETAVGVLKLYYRQKECFVRFKQVNGMYVSERWRPHEVPIAIKPPSKNRRAEEVV